MNAHRVVGIAVLATLAVIADPSAALAADTRVTVCGAVKAFTPATSTSDGSITVGSQTLLLAQGTSVATVNPTIQSGVNGCFSGTQRDNGSFIDYGVTPFPTAYCGTVASFVPPTGTTSGSVTLGTTARVTFIVPSTTQLPVSAGTGSQCFAIATDRVGDAIVTGLTSETGGLGGGAATASPTTPIPSAAGSAADAQHLPSTSTDFDPRVWGLLAFLGMLTATLSVLVWRSRRMRT